MPPITALTVMLVFALWMVAHRDLRWSWYVLTISAWLMTVGVALVADGAGSGQTALTVTGVYAISAVALAAGMPALFKAITIVLGAPVAVLLVLAGVT